MSQNNNKSRIKRLDFQHKFTRIYLFIMFTIFPLVTRINLDKEFPFFNFSRGYYSIRHEKYYFFLAISGLAVFLVAALFILYENHPVDYIKTKYGAKFYKRFSVTDWAVIAFLVVSIISTLLSTNKNVAFFGEPNGRNNGLLLIGFYVMTYFMITRCFEHKEYIFIGLSIGCGIAFLLGVLNEFYIDPLKMFSTFTSEGDILKFISTLGNKNIFSSFICVTLPIIFAMSVVTEKRLNRIVYIISSCLGFMAVVACDSDSVIIGVGAFIAVSFIFFVRDVVKLKRYFLTLSFVFLSLIALRFFSYFLKDVYKPLGTFSNLLLYSGFKEALFAICIVTFFVLYLYNKNEPNKVFSKSVQIVFIVLFGIGILSVFGAFLYYSVFDTESRIGELENILRFNDKWGTHRGYMWIRSFWIFGDASFLKKLFGSGPDTFYFVFEPYFEEMKQYGDSSTNAAHNEYLNYLITLGITGLCAYLTMIVSSVTRAIKSAVKNPMSLVFVLAVIGYATQSLVNIAQPITTPLFIIMVALCEASARNNLDS